MSIDQYWMQQALLMAQQAAEKGEVPVGAIVVYENEVIGEGWNHPISSRDPSSHAEINAIRAAAKRLANYRLSGAELYVTLEPCVMCAGAIVHARFSRVIFGAYDPRAGAAGSVFEILPTDKLNHRVKVKGGVMETASAALLQGFFRQRRDKGKQNQ